MLDLLVAYFSHRFASLDALAHLAQKVARHSVRLNRLEIQMSKNSEALADLDLQIDDLEAYVVSDDVTDAAEVQARVARIKEVLATAREEAPVEPPVEEPQPEPAQ